MHPPGKHCEIVRGQRASPPVTMTINTWETWETYGTQSTRKACVVDSNTSTVSMVIDRQTDSMNERGEE